MNIGWIGEMGWVVGGWRLAVCGRTGLEDGGRHAATMCSRVGVPSDATEPDVREMRWWRAGP